MNQKAKVTMNEFKGPESVGYERIIVLHNALKGKCIFLVKFAKQVKCNKINNYKPKMQWNANTGQVRIQCKLLIGQCDHRSDSGLH